MNYYGLAIEFAVDVTKAIVGQNWISCVGGLLALRFPFPNVHAFGYKSFNFGKYLRVELGVVCVWRGFIACVLLPMFVQSF